MVRRPKNWGNIRGGEEDERVPNHGLVPRGYDNMGPFNEVIIGPAGRNAADVEARDHDLQYGEEEAVGVTPHLQWVDADEEFLQDLQPTNWEERIAQGVFSLKKAAKNIGLVRDMSSKGKGKRKALRQNPWVEGDEYRQAREEKRKRMEDNWRTRDQAWENAEKRLDDQEAFAARGEIDRQIRINQAIQAHDDEQEHKENGPPDGFTEVNWDAFTADDVREGWNLANPTNALEPSLPNLPEDAEDDHWWEEPMDTTNDDVEMTAARAASGGGPNPVSKETPISPYPTLTYGLQETHTTILPFTFWFSSACHTVDAPAVMKIRLNSIYDFVTSPVDGTLASGGVPVSGTNYGRPIAPDGKGAWNTFPETINDGTFVETPYWRNYWAQIYEYYTVLGCEYKITTNCVNTSSGYAAIVGHTIDSWSDTATETGNITPTTKLSEAMSLKGMKFDVLRGARPETQGQQMTVIQGRYRPGQARRNIVNDGDVKTWTKCSFDGATPENFVPTLKETLNLYFWRAPLANIVSNNAEVTACNTQVELKWIVQFKDLRNLARYPVTTPVSTFIHQHLTNNRLDIGNPIARWV